MHETMNGSASGSVPCAKVVCALLSGFVVASTIVDGMTRISVIVVVVVGIEDVVRGHSRSEIPLSG